MSGSNDNYDSLARHRIDKGIVPVDVSAGTEMPNGILSMKPLRATPTNYLGPNVSRVEPAKNGPNAR
jgi:hypothetical protein